jgi:hypothetical protein
VRQTLTPARRAVQVARREGLRGVATRAVRRAYKSLGAEALEFPLLPGDVADSERLAAVAPLQVPPGRAPVVGWLSTPPSLGSGGHTTMFRMIEGLERAGVRCVLFLYDRHGGDVAEQRKVVRSGWPDVKAEVVGVEDGISGVDACFATSWQSAHVLALRGAPAVRRMYFVQDYEPYFYPRGSLYALAEDSYRFDFRTVALGGMVANTLKQELGVDSDTVPFGCDSQTYRLTGAGPRTGVVFYSKPDVPRRGYAHIRLALDEFHRRHPEQEIHAYGDQVTGMTFPVTWHGRMWPEELNDLYNRTLGGIAMSFTNITLVAEEMLAAGNIPVVNDSPFARAVLDNPYVAWARPTPAALADELCRVVEAHEPDERAVAASRSVETGWEATQRAVVEVVSDECGVIV